MRRIVWWRATKPARCKDDPGHPMVGRQHRRFVAVVDDDTGVREAIEGLLRSHGLKTRCFSSAEQLLSSSQRSQLVCLVLDMHLPGMSGLDLLRQLRTTTARHIPVICVTAEDDTGGRLSTQLLQAGALAVLRKPFDPEQLVSLVQNAITG
jgi:FixJ family two-component response regulator